MVTGDDYQLNNAFSVSNFCCGLSNKAGLKVLLLTPDISKAYRVKSNSQVQSVAPTIPQEYGGQLLSSLKVQHSQVGVSKQRKSRWRIGRTPVPNRESPSPNLESKPHIWTDDFLSNTYIHTLEDSSDTCLVGIDADWPLIQYDQMQKIFEPKVGIKIATHKSIYSRSI